ncbi:hypothetical protein [Nocardia sp. NPDC051981]|uniref:hypothetical protein n=1 Tax=Nocardia sp. NPDC051981 TaxID=3155417 RepID=UPI00342B5FD4
MGERCPGLFQRTLAAGNAIADSVLAESFAELSAAERKTLQALLQRVGPGSRA